MIHIIYTDASGTVGFAWYHDRNSFCADFRDGVFSEVNIEKVIEGKELRLAITALAQLSDY